MHPGSLVQGTAADVLVRGAAASRYTRRALLMGAYTASELYMLSDCSPGFADTWDALDRRLEGVLGAEGAAGGSLVHVVGNAAGEALAQLGSLLRRP